MHCATNRLKVTNDYKKTNSVGQIVSNVSESVKPANDGLILFLGLRSVKQRGGRGGWGYSGLHTGIVLCSTSGIDGDCNLLPAIAGCLYIYPPIVKSMVARSSSDFCLPRTYMQETLFHKTFDSPQCFVVKEIDKKEADFIDERGKAQTAQGYTSDKSY